MTLTIWDVWGVFPPGLWLPVATSLALPLVALGALRLAAHRRRLPLALQLSARTGVLVGGALALSGVFAIANSVRLGLEALLPSAARSVQHALLTLDAEWRTGRGDAAMVAALSSAYGLDARVRMLVVGRYPCRTPCMPVSLGLGRRHDHERLLRQVGDIGPGHIAAARLIEGVPIVVARAPLRDQGGDPTGLLVVGLDARIVLQRATGMAWQLVLVSLLIAVLASLTAGAAMRGFFATRFDALLARLEVTAGPVPPDATTTSSRDELARLSATVDRVVERAVDLTSRLQEAQRLETVGRLAGGVAHEFNNLMTTVIGHADLARMSLSPTAAVRGDLLVISEAAQDAARLTTKLLQYAGRQMDRRRVLDLAAVVSGVQPALRAALGEDHDLAVTVHPGLPVVADAAHIEQVLLELAHNARAAMPQGGALRIVATPHVLTQPLRAFGLEAPAGAYVRLVVQDTGHGIAPDVLPHIFDPFYSTQPMHAATGLGLAAVRGILQAHHAVVEVQSRLGHGTTFRLYFPRNDQ